jgi:hypothetical protein
VVAGNRASGRRLIGRLGSVRGLLVGRRLWRRQAIRCDVQCIYLFLCIYK